MRILIIGRARPYSNETGIYRELVRRGHRVALVDDRRLRQVVGRRLTNAWLRKRAQTFRPEYLILQKALDVDLDFLAEWCARIPSVMWFRDLVIPPTKEILERARLVNTVFLTAGGQAPEWEALGVRRALFLPDAADPDYDRPVPPDRRFACDVAFMGLGYNLSRGATQHVYGDRARVLLRIAERHHVRVWGRRWEPWRKELNWAGREARGKDFGRVCSSAKVVLGIQPRNVVWGYQSNRMVRVLARGGFFMGHAGPGLRELFRNGEHCAWYDDEEHLLEQLAYYLARPEERERIARAGREFVLRYHTYAQRVDNLLTGQPWSNPLAESTTPPAGGGA